ncbi:MAG: septum formation initiator family protein [Ginsengibacter sp.]|jgi:cell division protein FtsB
MKKIKKIITNKYFLAGTTFFVWILFFDQNSLLLQFRKTRELNQLKESERTMTQQIQQTKYELQLLKTNPATLERYAREKYLMRKDNEDLFVVTIDSSLIK